MPLALLLQGLFKAIGKGVKQLTPWADMALTEELLVDRARGAFMVHWFGAGLPLEGLSVRLAIANLDALRARFSEVLAERNRRLTASGPNLLEPLAGLSGVVAGLLVTPTGQLLAMIGIDGHLTEWWQGLLQMLNWVSGGLLGSGAGLVLGVAALPLALIGSVAMLATDPESIRRAYNFLGALARAMDATQRFIALLLGPREAIRNPLLRRILEVADRVAHVTMQGIGVFALLITRVGPLLGPLPAQLRAFHALMAPVMEILAALFRDLVDRITALYQGEAAPFTIVRDLFDAFITQLRRAFRRFGQAMTKIAATFEKGAANVATRLGGWSTTIGTELADAFRLHETVQVILALIRIFRTAAPHFRSTTPPAPPSGGLLQRIKDAIVGAVTPPSLPAFPALPALPDVDRLSRQISLPADLSLRSIRLEAGRVGTERQPGFEALSRRVGAAARRARRPVSHFTPERERLRRELGDLGATPAEALETLYRRQIPFRSALADAVALAAAERIPALREVFSMIDRHLFERAESSPEARAAPLFPVRLVPEVEFLRPDVGELRIRAAGVERTAAVEWGRSLEAALLARNYPAELAPG